MADDYIVTCGRYHRYKRRKTLTHNKEGIKEDLRVQSEYDEHLLQWKRNYVYR